VSAQAGKQPFTAEDMLKPVAHLFIWDTDRAALAEVPRQPGVSIAANTDLDWTPDGAKLIVALRTPGQDREAKARFKAITEGPVIVQKSSEAFMEWDTIGRMSRERELVELDVKTGQRTTLLAARKISSYDVARDGSFLTFMQDVTGKTDYVAFTSVTPLTNLNVSEEEGREEHESVNRRQETGDGRRKTEDGVGAELACPERRRRARPELARARGRSCSASHLPDACGAILIAQLVTGFPSCRLYSISIRAVCGEVTLRNSHCRTASMAPCASRPGPSTSFTDTTLPETPMTASRITVPSILAATASGG
jgi:hypothetical protein